MKKFLVSEYEERKKIHESEMQVSIKIFQSHIGIHLAFLTLILLTIWSECRKFALVNMRISEFLARIIFKFNFVGGKLKEFLNFSYTNLISLFAPNLIWFVINFIDDTLQKDELWFLLITILINGAILPIKYLIYKFFVFKDSL